MLTLVLLLSMAQCLVVYSDTGFELVVYQQPMWTFTAWLSFVLTILAVLVAILSALLLVFCPQLINFFSSASNWIMMVQKFGGVHIANLFGLGSIYRTLIAFQTHRSKLACDGSRFGNVMSFLFSMAVQLFVTNALIGFAIYHGKSFASLFLDSDFYMCSSFECLGEFAGQTSSTYLSDLHKVLLNTLEAAQFLRYI